MPLARLLQLARLEAAVTRMSSIMQAGFLLINAMLVCLLAKHGEMLPDAWIGTMGIGVAVLSIKVFLDAKDK